MKSSGTPGSLALKNGKKSRGCGFDSHLKTQTFCQFPIAYNALDVKGSICYSLSRSSSHCVSGQMLKAMVGNRCVDNTFYNLNAGNLHDLFSARRQNQYHVEVVMEH